MTGRDFFLEESKNHNYGRGFTVKLRRIDQLLRALFLRAPSICRVKPDVINLLQDPTLSLR